MTHRDPIHIELAGVRRLVGLLGYSADLAVVMVGLLRELRLVLSPVALMLVALALLAGCKPTKFDHPAPERPPKSSLGSIAPINPAAP
ncbi:hypothetical protein SJR98_07460 [Aeromonas hydrophila]|uniref:hypothetical protein n=1 Tax=Aeromonas hydrophila TaxID=644 RepID=UPI0029D970A6|nr:hypothetical protein [Aeromonas hydrophila]MDX7777915.1 hypothetical protein [Aeromonas hydrophila]